MISRTLAPIVEEWTPEHEVALLHHERIHALSASLDILNPEGQGLVHFAVVRTQKIGEKPGSMSPLSTWSGPDGLAKLQTLIQLGADKNLKNKDGLTARDLAFIGGHALAFDALAAADMTIKNQAGEQPQSLGEVVGSDEQWERLQGFYEQARLAEISLSARARRAVSAAYFASNEGQHL